MATTTNPVWQEIGYTPKTTFWQDFTIAENFSIEDINDTYERAFNEWHTNIEYVTELAMVVNHKIWQWYKVDDKIARTYNTLWEKISNWAYVNLKGDDAHYYYRTLD